MSLQPKVKNTLLPKLGQETNGPSQTNGSLHRKTFKVDHGGKIQSQTGLTVISSINGRTTKLHHGQVQREPKPVLFSDISESSMKQQQKQQPRGPRMHPCNHCGKQFGQSSLPIHMKNCSVKYEYGSGGT